MARFKMECFWVLVLWCCSVFGNGEILCKSEPLKHINISTELQSDVLLPCNFSPTLLGSDKTADIAVVWSERNTTVYNLLLITLQGDVKFLDYKGGRVKPFPKLSESGNFSILLQKVQLYDLTLYHCELFNGTGCSIAYREIQLGLTRPQKSIIAAASVGAVLCFFITCVCRMRNKYKQQPESSHENCYTEVMYTLHSTDQI